MRSPAIHMRALAAAAGAALLAGCVSSAPRTDTVSMDEFRKMTQAAPSGAQKVVMRGKRGSYYYADVYEPDPVTAKAKLSYEIRTQDTSGETFRQSSAKDKGPVQMEFQQLPTGIHDPMEGSNYIDNPPPLSVR